ncbi:MAG TPA: phosphate ABC transporter substrate-binding protein [Candidatus Saccharicenans sp.]|nr:phosphate ABC transporter substrate-binding protein [Candidatus Saccharicenans sp.]HQM74269.1 phosphate ABC transporter substrate-binding protein [Candidatus Saccharicenans sp.]
MNSESKKSREKYRQTGLQSFFRGRLNIHLNCRTITGALSLAVYLILASLCWLSISACKSGSRQNEIVIAGSTSIQPFADGWAELFMEKHSEVTVNVQGGGSSSGIMAVKERTAHIGMSSRELKEDEKDLIEITVAYDGLAIIVHPSNPVDNLSLDQVRSIFAGEIANWKVLNGTDKDITVVVREEGSGTRGAFQEMVMGSRRISKKAIVEDSNGVVREIVSRDRHSIGFISLGLVDERVKAIALDGLRPSEEAITQGHYHLRRPFLFLVREEPRGLIKEFIDFVLSDDIQSRLPQEGLIPVKKIAAAGSFQD